MTNGPKRLALIATILALGSCAALYKQRPKQLRINSVGYPKAFFFRSTEAMARDTDWSFERWEETFSGLDGIMGKIFDEELLRTELRNIEFFSRFKRNHPKQLALVHYNGNARDPRYETEAFFAGHWLHYGGCGITQDLPARDGESIIHVEDPSLFRANIGRYGKHNEDLVICSRKPNGDLDFSQAEQLELIAVDTEQKTLRVRRGAFGTRPRSFKKGESHIAAHVTRGPWCDDCNLLWVYNHSLNSPRDSDGRSCNDVLVEDVARHFEPGGRAELLDGIEFDAIPHFCPNRGDSRGVDTDGDGNPDNGVVGNRNVFGIGVYEFCVKMRKRLGKNRLLLADAGHPNFQRCLGQLNGMESEGFPNSRDFEIEQWSSGVNRLNFWNLRSNPPVLNYLNHRYVKRTPGPKRFTTIEPIPFGRTRLVLAAAQILDAPVTYGVPETKEGQWIGIYDELRMGAAKKLNWLGRPQGPPVQIAQGSRDLLDGEGIRITDTFIRRLHSDQAELEFVTSPTPHLKLESKESLLKTVGVELTGVELIEPGDLLLQFNVRAESLPGYPEAIARNLNVACVRSEEGSTTNENSLDRSEASGATVLSTLADKRWFSASFYFRQLEAGTYSFQLNIEGAAPVYFSDFEAYSHPDVMYREFDHGLVLVNPSLQSHDFDVGALMPGKSFSRLQGSADQDPETNNGEPVDNIVTVPARDGLFLMKIVQ